jgi:hypothetical protein
VCQALAYQFDDNWKSDVCGGTSCARCVGHHHFSRHPGTVLRKRQF